MAAGWSPAIKQRVANAGLFQERWTLRRPTATFDADVVQQRGSSVAGNVMLPQL